MILVTVLSSVRVIRGPSELVSRKNGIRGSGPRK